MTASGRLTLGAGLAAAGPAERVAIQLADADRRRFAALDSVLAGLLDASIRGHQSVEILWGPRRTTQDRIALRVDDAQRQTLGPLSCTAQEAAGAWYLPATARLDVGTIDFAWVSSVEARYSLAAADTMRPTVEIDTPESVAAWSALEPILSALFLPVKLRSGNWLGERRPDQMAAAWNEVDACYEALGIDRAPLTVFKDGAAWAHLDLEGVTAARSALLDSWRGAPPDVGLRALAWHTGKLVERYYSKAKAGVALRNKVLNTTVERPLTACFGGDWMALLDYLEEEPHPDEQVIVAVPPTQILSPTQPTSTGDPAPRAAPVGETEMHRILASLWGGSPESPLSARTQVARRWWAAFEVLWDNQKPGMRSLWGLVADRGEDNLDAVLDGRYTPRAWQELPADVISEIENLWGSCLLARWPDAIVTEPYPHAACAEAFGPALEFWHGVALTCWFICEGPMSRTGIDGMADYYDRQLKALDDLGCAVDPSLFTDLLNAAKLLTDRPSVPTGPTRTEAHDGFTMTVTPMSPEGQKDGFEHLRDVLRQHRAKWTTAHLDSYLEHRWETELRATGDAYHRTVADRAKPPTAKAFAKIAEGPANHWFGGNLADLAASLAISAPPAQTRCTMLPADRSAFVQQVNDILEGRRWADSPDDMDRDERTSLLRRWELAMRSPLIVQRWEATGAAPGPAGLSWVTLSLEDAFGPDRDSGWRTYLAAIERACRHPVSQANVRVARTADPSQSTRISVVAIGQPPAARQPQRRQAPPAPAPPPPARDPADEAGPARRAGGRLARWLSRS